jgi:hypothetical protein
MTFWQFLGVLLLGGLLITMLITAIFLPVRTPEAPQPYVYETICVDGHVKILLSNTDRSRTWETTSGKCAVEKKQ